MVKIFHNPTCGTSRNTLALIRNSGVEPEVVLYLETPPSKEQLKKLISDMSMLKYKKRAVSLVLLAFLVS